MVRSGRLVWLLVCLLCLPAAADEGSPVKADPFAGPHAFDDALSGIREQLAEGESQAGLDALNALLEAHKEKNYVKARKEEVIDLVRRLRCGVQFKRPRPRDLVSGELQSWSRKTGKLKIKYKPDKAKDLEQRKDWFFFPPRLNGPFSFEVKGKAWPAGKEPQVRVSGDQDPDTGAVISWTLTCGVPGKKNRGPRLVYRNGENEDVVGKKKSSPGKADKPFKIVVKTTKTKLSTTVNGRSVGSSKKPADVWGYLSFHAPGWTELKITGSVDPEWLQSQIDDVVYGQLQEFDKTFRPRKHVPGWIYEPLTRQRRHKAKEVDLLADLNKKEYNWTLDVENHMRMDDFDEALAGIDKMQKAGVREATCELLRAKCREHMGDLDESLVHLEKCLALEPAFLDGALMRGSLLRKMGRHKAALDNFRQMVLQHAGSALTYEGAARLLLTSGRPGDASEITRMAARNGVTSTELRQLNKALAKVVEGPKWRKRFQHKSQNYHVMSDMGQAMCRESAEMLEELFNALRKTMGWVPRDTSRLFKVFVFSDKAGFMGYQKDLSEFMGKPNDKAAGLYTPLLKQLLIWNHSSHEAVLSTVRHEGFHQYLDRLMDGAPVWFNEGLAEYHENPSRKGGKLEFGKVYRGHVKTLLSRGMRPMKKFINGSPFLFYEDGFRSYAQAWALMHMFQHSTEAYAKLFKKMVADFKKEPSYIVTKRLMTDAFIAKLEKDLKDYVEELDAQ